MEEALITHFTEQQHNLITKRGVLLQFDGGSRIVTRATERTLVPKRRRRLLGLYERRSMGSVGAC